MMGTDWLLVGLVVSIGVASLGRLSAGKSQDAAPLKFDDESIRKRYQAERAEKIGLFGALVTFTAVIVGTRLFISSDTKIILLAMLLVIIAGLALLFLMRVRGDQKLVRSQEINVDPQVKPADDDGVGGR